MNTPLPLKCIFRGKLELGNARAFERMKSHFQNRLETLYKSDIFYTMEAEIKEDDFSIVLPSSPVYLSEKSYRKSMELLKELAQYGYAGRIRGWAIDSGRIIYHDEIQPVTQKDSVAAYHTGLELSGTPGNEEAAFETLTESIKGFDRNPLAYDRRGFISYKMGKYTNAIIDFEKSIAIYAENPEPYYGLGRCYVVKEDWKKALEKMQLAMKYSIPHQQIYHTARLYAGIASYRLGDYANAQKELEAFLARQFSETDHNYRKRYLAYKFLGKTHLAKDELHNALDCFNLAYTLAQEFDQEIDRAAIFPSNMPTILAPRVQAPTTPKKGKNKPVSK